MNPTFFPTPAAFRAWLKKNHAKVDELWVGFYKKGTGRKSITWPESVDEALCFGWIDGVRKSIDEEAYVIRFTPRRSGSNWSNVNLRRVEQLIAEKRMQPAGLAAYEARTAAKSGVYSFERERAAFPPELEARFRANRAAWTFFEAQPPSYRRVLTWWVISAKQEATRERRLSKLIETSAAGRRMT